MVPGDTRIPYEHGAQARQILSDAEDDIRDWQPEIDQFEEHPVEDSHTQDLKGKNKESPTKAEEVASMQAQLKAAEAGTEQPAEGAQTAQVA